MTKAPQVKDEKLITDLYNKLNETAVEYLNAGGVLILWAAESDDAKTHTLSIRASLRHVAQLLFDLQDRVGEDQVKLAYLTAARARANGSFAVDIGDDDEDLRKWTFPFGKKEKNNNVH